MTEKGSGDTAVEKVTIDGKSGYSRLMALLDTLSRDLVKVPLLANDKNEVLHELLGILDSAGKVRDRPAAFEALVERENLGSTGLERGIAIPHAQTDAVDDLTIAIGVAPQGIAFGSMDGQLSRIFFLILTAPEQSHAHLEALSEIARMSQSETLLTGFVNSRSPAGILMLLRG